jgi:pyruvate kinase
MVAYYAQGNMPALLSHYRPDDQIFVFTENRAVQRRLALYHGITALHMRFGETADETFDRCPLRPAVWFKN